MSKVGEFIMNSDDSYCVIEDFQSRGRRVTFEAAMYFRQSELLGDLNATLVKKLEGRLRVLREAIERDFEDFRAMAEKVKKEGGAHAL